MSNMTFDSAWHKAHRYLTRCATCGGHTSRKYAREHNGNCKACVTGVAPKPKYQCPDCGGPRTRFQARRGYHCDGCTRRVEQTGGIYGF